MGLLSNLMSAMGTGNANFAQGGLSGNFGDMVKQMAMDNLKPPSRNTSPFNNLAHPIFSTMPASTQAKDIASNMNVAAPGQNSIISNLNTTLAPDAQSGGLQGMLKTLTEGGADSQPFKMFLSKLLGRPIAA